MKLTRKSVLILLALALVISFFMRLYQINEAFFNFDQDRDAWQMKQLIIKRKPTLIGPDIRRGRLKFFLGPYHYYFFLPSLYLSNLDPIGPIIFAALIGVATTLLVFFVGKEIFGVVTGLIASFLHAGSFYLSEAERMPWNPFHLSYLSLFLFYFLAKALKGKIWFMIPATMIFALMLQVHPTAVFLAPLIFFGFYQLYSQKVAGLMKTIILSVVVFFLISSPLIIFDLRHQFINSQMFLSSLRKTGVVRLEIGDRIDAFWRVLSYIHQEIVNFFTRGRNFATVEEGQWLVLLPISFLYFMRSKEEIVKKRRMIILLLLPWLSYLLAFTVLSNDIDKAVLEGELQLYYFRPVAIGYLFVFAFTLTLMLRLGLPKRLFIFSLIIYLAVAVNWRYKYENPYSYINKKHATQYIIDKAAGRPFSLNFKDQHGFGYLDGFRYLFSLYQTGDLKNYKNPSFTISIPPEAIAERRFGNIGVFTPMAYSVTEE